MVEELLGTETIQFHRGTINPLEEITKVKVIGFLFFKIHCPMSKEVLQVMIEKYNKINQNGQKVLEIVYCEQSGICDLEDDEEYKK